MLRRGFLTAIYIGALLSVVPCVANAAQTTGVSDLGANELDKSHVAPQDAMNVVWRSERVCGVNCLYFLMRSLGRDPDYLHLQQELLGERLTSLYDLKQAASVRDVPLQLSRLTPKELQQVPKPVIAHFDVVDVRNRQSGHFVVVTRADDAGVEFVDGSTAESVRSDWRAFQRDWSGFTAYIDRSGAPWGWSGALALLAGLGFGWWMDRLWLRNHRRGTP